ncbi:MAG TPA: hypothetical protein VF193_05565 [Steroidobacter sp.]
MKRDWIELIYSRLRDIFARATAEHATPEATAARLARELIGRAQRAALMAATGISLGDKYRPETGPVFISGRQALVLEGESSATAIARDSRTPTS